MDCYGQAQVQTSAELDCNDQHQLLSTQMPITGDASSTVEADRLSQIQLPLAHARLPASSALPCVLIISSGVHCAATCLPAAALASSYHRQPTHIGSLALLRKRRHLGETGHVRLP